MYQVVCIVCIPMWLKSRERREMQATVRAAIEKGDDFLAQMVERCRAGGEQVFQRLSGLPRVTIARPEAAFYAFFSVDGVEDTMADPQIQLILAIYGALIPALVLWGIAAIFYRIGVRNVVMNATRFDSRHTLFSDLGRLRYFWIVISNLVVTVLTLSLMRPWAAVREHRYVIEHSGIVVDGELDDVVSSMQASGSAVTAEYLDLEGFDFGF